MLTNCFTCGKELDRFPSRLKANPTQFCDFVCLGIYRSRQVDVTCAICGKVWQVKASRATKNDAITCSPACLGKLRSANRVRYFGTAETRQATCVQCGTSFIRKPSQLAKYGESFCSRACHSLAKVGQEHPKTGEWVPCEVCGKDVWRTPATKRDHVFCSQACVGLHEREMRKGKPSFSVRRGPDNHNWKGGRGPYAEGWGPLRSKAIRERDGNKCRACGATNDLLVHHIDRAKFDHSDANLITLCRSCHGLLHGGRPVVIAGL